MEKVLNKIEKDIIDVTLKILKDHPEDWSWNDYSLRNDKIPVEIWLANGGYGLHINFDATYVGGVTEFSSIFGSLIPWRRKIIKECYNIINKFHKVQKDSPFAIYEKAYVKKVN